MALTTYTAGEVLTAASLNDNFTLRARGLVYNANLQQRSILKFN
jgi:hypothetical protein